MIRMARIFAIFVLLLGAGLLASCNQQPTADTPTDQPYYVLITTTPAPTEAGNPQETAEPTEQESNGLMIQLPNPYICKSEIVEQTFENGFMLWVGVAPDYRCLELQPFEVGSGEIWVAILDSNGLVGKWMIFPDVFDESIDMVRDPDYVPPSDDLYQPTRGFGKVWRENLTEQQRQQLGWATASEFKYATFYRFDSGGFINTDGEYIARPGMHRFILLNGDEIIFDDHTRAVFYLPADPIDWDDILPVPTSTPGSTLTPTPTPTGEAVDG
nr:hypothetical protein [Anaerolineae bacterium]